MKRLLVAALILSSCATPSGPVRPYPLTTCLVTENKLGSMGDPITKVYDGQEVKFCCRPCIEEFEEAPEQFLEQIAEAK